MKESLLKELLESACQGCVIPPRRGVVLPRTLELSEEPDVAIVREQLGLSRPELGFNVGMLGNGEEGRHRRLQDAGRRKAQKTRCLVATKSALPRLYIMLRSGAPDSFD